MKIAVNMSLRDRVIRFIIVLVIIIILWTKLLHGALKTILGIIGIVLVITSIYGFCPMYAFLKKNRKKNSKK